MTQRPARSAGGLDLMLVDRMHDMVTGGATPDLTIVLDLDPELSLQRTRDRGDHDDRFEKKGLDYQRKVREGFLHLARRSPDSHVLIDAAGGMDVVAARVMDAVEKRLLSTTVAPGA